MVKQRTALVGGGKHETLRAVFGSGMKLSCVCPVDYETNAMALAIESCSAGGASYQTPARGHTVVCYIPEWNFEKCYPRWHHCQVQKRALLEFSNRSGPSHPRPPQT